MKKMHAARKDVHNKTIKRILEIFPILRKSAQGASIKKIANDNFEITTAFGSSAYVVFSEAGVKVNYIHAESQEDLYRMLDKIAKFAVFNHTLTLLVYENETYMLDSRVITWLEEYGFEPDYPATDWECQHKNDGIKNPYHYLHYILSPGKEAGIL